jgi:adenylate kinase
MKYKYLILLGAPGAGKGTQASFLREQGLIHIASGDLFREAVSAGTELGLQAKAYMDKGMLVPDEITIKLILERLASLGDEQGFVLDGFPRTLEQAKALDRELGRRNKGVDKVVYIKVSSEELIRRLSGRWICRQCQAPYHLLTSPPQVEGKCDRCGGELYQRADDTPETVRKRLEVYFEQTIPLIDYYRQSGKLAEINGEQSIAQVNQELLTVLSQ